MDIPMGVQKHQNQVQGKQTVQGILVPVRLDQRSPYGVLVSSPGYGAGAGGAPNGHGANGAKPNGKSPPMDVSSLQ